MPSLMESVTGAMLVPNSNSAITMDMPMDMLSTEVE